MYYGNSDWLDKPLSSRRTLSSRHEGQDSYNVDCFTIDTYNRIARFYNGKNYVAKFRLEDRQNYNHKSSLQLHLRTLNSYQDNIESYDTVEYDQILKRWSINYDKYENCFYVSGVLPGGRKWETSTIKTLSYFKNSITVTTINNHFYTLYFDEANKREQIINNYSTDRWYITKA